MTDPLAPPPVSVVLPAYNRAGVIRGAIESVLRQSFTDFELIVVDDCSTDATAAEAAEVADPRVRLIRHEANRGASAARNTGIRAARAPWVAFQDSDDEWLPLKLEKQMARLAAPGAEYVAVYSGMLILGVPEAGGAASGGRPVISYMPRPDLAPVEGEILPTLMRTSIVSTQTLVARRDLLLEIGGFDETMPALIDWECMLRLAPLGPVACVDEPLVLQRFSANSITRDAPRRAAARDRAVEKHRALLERDPAALARLYYIVAGDHRITGNYPAAARALAKARALAPGNPRIWAMSLYLALLRRFGAPPAA
jgi:hypothetical protein